MPMDDLGLAKWAVTVSNVCLLLPPSAFVIILAVRRITHKFGMVGSRYIVVGMLKVDSQKENSCKGGGNY